MSQDSLQKLRSLMKSNKFCMLTTNSSEKQMHSRPMTLQQTEFDGDLWFFTGRNTDVASDIEADPRVNLSFSDGSSEFVSVSGTARFVDDAAKKRELWNDMYKTWFPGGLNDPNLLLMKVQVENAEYWDTPGAKVMQLFGAIEMMVTHKPPASEHKEIDITQSQMSE